MAKRFSGRNGCITTERTKEETTERVSFSINDWVIFNYSSNVWRGIAKSRHITSKGDGEGNFRRPGGEYHGKIVIESVSSEGLRDESEIHFSGKGKLEHISLV